jgi:hypothetical protein
LSAIAVASVSPVVSARCSLPFAIAAVAGVLGLEDRPGTEQVLPRLLSLAEKSLLLPLAARQDEWAELRTSTDAPRQQGPDAWTRAGAHEVQDEGAEPAFGMLETVREYAWERLAAAGELTAARRAHAQYFLTLAQRADHSLRGRDQRAWIFQLEREHDNLRAARRWFLDQTAQDGSDLAIEREAGLQLAGALGYFWYVHGYHAGRPAWVEQALAGVPEEADSVARTRALVTAGPLLMVQAEYAR